MCDGTTLDPTTAAVSIPGVSGSTVLDGSTSDASTVATTDDATDAATDATTDDATESSTVATTDAANISNTPDNLTTDSIIIYNNTTAELYNATTSDVDTDTVTQSDATGDNTTTQYNP